MHIKKEDIVFLVLITIFEKLGSFFGFFSRIIDISVSKFLFSFLDSYHTSRLKGQLKSLGFRSKFSIHTTIVGGNYITIGDNTYFAKFCQIEAWPNKFEVSPCLTIRSGCEFGEFTHISCSNKITIGKGVLTGRFVLITDNSHGKVDNSEIDIPPTHRKIYSKGPVFIGDNVWICDKVSIMAGVTIGNGSILAANSVVTHDVPPFSLVAGCPAKVIKMINN